MSDNPFDDPEETEILHEARKEADRIRDAITAEAISKDQRIAELEAAITKAIGLIDHDNERDTRAARDLLIRAKETP